jgi:hypothetical protein
MINDQWIEKFQREALPQIIKNLKPKKFYFLDQGLRAMLHKTLISISF